jgi:hypothetical protein
MRRSHTRHQRLGTNSLNRHHALITVCALSKNVRGRAGTQVRSVVAIEDRLVSRITSAQARGIGLLRGIGGDFTVAVGRDNRDYFRRLNQCDLIASGVIRNARLFC